MQSILIKFRRRVEGNKQGSSPGSRDAGIGSMSHDFDANFIMIFLTSSSDAGSKLKTLFLILGFWTVGTSFTWFEKLARIVLIWSQKYFAKCSQRDFALFEHDSYKTPEIATELLTRKSYFFKFSHFYSHCYFSIFFFGKYPYSYFLGKVRNLNKMDNFFYMLCEVVHCKLLTKLSSG